MQRPLELIAEQRAERLARSHAVQKLLGEPHARRRQIDRRRLTAALLMREVPAAEDRGGRRMVDRWGVDVSPRDGRGLRPHIVDPAIRADVQGRGVPALAAQGVEPRRRQCRVPGVEAMRVEIQGLPENLIEIVGRKRRQTRDGLPEGDEWRRPIGPVLVEIARRRVRCPRAP